MTKEVMEIMDEEGQRKTLRKFLCLVEFTKADGTRRVMRCTTAPDLLEKYEAVEEGEAEGYKPAPRVPGLIRVFDVEKKGWRSYRVDRVTKFTLVSLSQG